MERELATFVKNKYKVTEADIDALSPAQYDALCEDAVEELERADADLERMKKTRQLTQEFADWILSHRP